MRVYKSREVERFEVPTTSSISIPVKDRFRINDTNPEGTFEPTNDEEKFEALRLIHKLRLLLGKAPIVRFVFEEREDGQFASTKSVTNGAVFVDEILLESVNG